jgi:glycosyltransferase involved in cell wall biosynthesis
MAHRDCPLLSALVLTYNHEEYIESCLKGLLSIDYPNLEICVLDDGSTDKTFEIASAFAASTERSIVAKTQPPSGGRTAENSQELLRMARGKYLLFMSGDDTVMPNFSAARIISEMEAHDNITMAFPRIVHVNLSDCTRHDTIYTPELQKLLQSGSPDDIYTEHLCKKVSRLFLQGVIARRSFIDDFGGFDTDLLADDYAFMVRAFAAMRGHEKRILFVSDNLCIYRVHGTSIHRNVSRQRDLAAEVVRKYIPAQYWADFRMDYGIPTDLNDFKEVCAHMVRYFGAIGEQQMVPKYAAQYVRFLLAKSDFVTLMKLLALRQTRWQTRFYAMRNLYWALPYPAVRWWRSRNIETN